MMRMYSSLTEPRRSKSGAPRAWNSSRNQPTPTPTVTRPFESTSMVASILAVTTGFRWGTIMTLGHQAESAGLARDEGHEGELLERVALSGERAGDRVGIFRVDGHGEYDVVGDHHGAEAQGLAALHQRLERLGSGRLSAGGEIETVAHGRPFGPSRIAGRLYRPEAFPASGRVL